MSCDAAYLTRGVITDVIHDKDTGMSSTNFLKDVDVMAYYIGKNGNVGPLINNHLSTDENGAYRLFFMGPPLGLNHDVFLEFLKPGYKKKKVFIDVKNSDPDVLIKKCSEKTKYQGCWVIDVRLIRQDD